MKNLFNFFNYFNNSILDISAGIKTYINKIYNQNLLKDEFWKNKEILVLKNIITTRPKL